MSPCRFRGHPSCRTLSVLLLVAMTGSGCGQSAAKPEIVPVNGTVMYNGQPVEGATVSFQSEGSPRAATGVTNAAGEFQLSTLGANDGAVPGEHRVIVSKVDTSAVPAPPVMTEEQARDPSKSLEYYQQQMAGGEGAKPAGPKYLVPQRYSDARSTPLKETVTKEGPNTFVLQLTD